MIEGLWSVKFATPFGTGGAGVVVFESGRILGGDAGFTYIGDYKLEPTGMLNAKVRVTKFDGVGLPSVFGPNMQDFDLAVSAPAVNPKGTTAVGAVPGLPGAQMQLHFIKRAELP